MTNREKLAKMTDEELGEFLCKHTECAYCFTDDSCYFDHTGYIDWLKAEAEEEE